MTHAAHIAAIEHELDGFHQSLVEYRQQMGAWYSRALNSVSHAADMPSLLGMDRVLRVGDSQRSVSLSDADFSTVARCPVGGVLKIESKFESAYDVPIGDIPVEVIGLDDGSSTRVMLDKHGKGSHYCAAGGRYQVRVQGGVSAQQVDALFTSYAGLTADLEQWLRSQWKSFKPHWESSTASAIGSGVLAGSWAAIHDVWDSLKLVQAMLEDPLKYVEQLGSEAAKLAQIATDAPRVMEQAMLLASDEAALYLLLRTAMIWLDALPPSEVAQAAARFMVSLLIDLVIGAVLTIALPAAGVAYLSMRLVKYGKQILAAAVGFVKGVLAILTKFMQAVDRYKAVAVRGVVGGLKQGTMQMRWKARQNAVLKQKERVDDVPVVASNPKGDAAAPADKTVTHGCPVSMVTGEELLTLTDGALDGILPFEWTRLYRTSAVEVDCGLGFGWSHALAHRLVVSGESVVWTDHENRRTQFPLPTDSRPAITNSLAEAAIYLGSAPDELVLAQASRFYHFRDGVLVSISDAYDNRLRICRDHSGRIERLDNGAGRSLLLRYELDRIVAVDYQVHRAKDRGPYVWETEQNVVSYAYDEDGRLVCATNAVGESERYRYDDQHVIVERQLAGGASFFWAWEGSGKAARCVRHWASFSQMDTRYAWGDDGRVTVHNADGSQEVYVHDDRARLVQRIDPDGAQHFKSYDDQGRLTVEQDPLGAVTAYQYDEAGRLVALFPGDDEPTSYEHDNGFVRVVRRGEAVWKYERNSQGDVTRRTDPDGQVTDYSYNKRGQLTGVWYPDHSCHRLVWNERGQLLEEQLPNGRIKRYRYDDLGRQVACEDEYGALTQYQWDSVGRLIRLVLPGGATREFSYNPYGKIIAERDELGHVTHYEYADGLHLISRRLNADGTQVHYRYDNARLLLTEIENEVGETYQLTYHPNGLLQQETGFDGQRTAYAYDLNGNLQEKTEYGDDNSQLITRYERDHAGRLVRKNLPDGSAIDYAYDRQGNLLSVEDGHWALAYEYDQQNRLVAEHQGWGTLRYGYDACGQLQNLRLPDNNRLTFNHDKGGHLATVELNGEVLTSHLFRAGREHQRQQGQLLSHYHYDDQNRLHAHAITQQQNYLYQRQYDYDKSGNLTRLLDTRKGEHRYHYDPLARLTRADHSQDVQERFAHNPAGNLLMQDRPGPDIVAANRLVIQGDRHYDYDAFGNLIRERRGKGQQLVTEYRYDCQHRLISVTKPNGETASYRYDPFGRRISKTVDGKTTEFFWQGDKLIAEHHADRHRSYIYEPDSFRPLALLEGFGPKATTPYHYQLDHLGTPQELTDTEGEIVWSAHYRAYGQIARLDVGKIDNPLRFQGQYFDQESGLHYNRHRYYNPDIGRYLTPDPVKLAGGVNGYQYVPNPTGWVDPLGLSKCLGEDGCKSQADVEEPADTAKVNTGEPNQPTVTTRPTEFASKQKLNEHYEKHGPEFGVETPNEYLLTARHVVSEGIPVNYLYKSKSTTGYVLLMGTNRTGQAKFAFAGTNADGNITTLHTKSGKDFWRMINGDATDKTIRPYNQ
ncbi:RHS repeat-associated core domain-containing protein [Pseudomonas synxantha]|uniref:Rhs protein n=6 Tax=Pseudomonas synxantha TaxID=47883 RepID=A0AAX3III7_9PSED|nr:RHS repeat-associated core domain-containing protein [Pseudomonas synxantha]AZE69565.1 Rhs-family protein [Pseudomonas synxantha]SDU60411.1 RHS repeat-associated core domain-containing protein [Pseudomonas synxantha]VTR05308.1 putative Rhs protein [Pseudomonas synxantha]